MGETGIEHPASLMAQRVEVWRGGHRDPENLFGPLPGLRVGDVVAYEFELPERFVPGPGRTSVERTFVALDVGVSFANPIGFVAREADTWYVDLVSVEQQADRYTFRDLYLDVIVPTDGRPTGSSTWTSSRTPSRAEPSLRKRRRTGFDAGNDSWIATFTPIAGRQRPGRTFRRSR